MNERHNLNSFISQNKCRVCLGVDAVRPMFAEEINWYSSVILMTAVVTPDPELNICTVCSWLLRKCMWFHQYCRNSQLILNRSVEQGTKVDLSDVNQSLHSFVQTRTEIHYLGLENDYNSDTKADIDDVIFHQDDHQDDDSLAGDRDDDIPLVMLNKADDGTKENRKGKKKRKKSKCNEKKENGTEIKTENDQEQLVGTVKNGKKPLKEGFTSRMVQETEEYVVIKLTREQVLEEMRERSQSEKYQRALYKCALCVQGFNFEDVLAAHMEKHTQENGSFECDMCSQYCPSAVSLRGHVKSHTTRYKCKICGEVRRGRQHLLEHHALTHGARAHQYSCHHCAFTTDKRTVIQRHVRSHRARERLACHQCGRLFRSVESLRVHATRHDASRALRCGECGRAFLYPSLLATHAARAHRRREYYCVECDVSFKSPDNLRLHFKKAKRHRDSSSYSYSCGQCPERFASSGGLRAHRSSAHGASRVLCALCRRPYASQESLRAHTRRAHRTAVTDTTAS